jgi:hypothetical protein
MYKDKILPDEFFLDIFNVNSVRHNLRFNEYGQLVYPLKRAYDEQIKLL